MPGKAHRVYWDANLYLSNINGDSDRLPTLDALVTALRTTKDMELVTSTLSITEVAFGQEEQGTATLDQAILERIDTLWKDTSIIKLVDVFPMIAYDARGLMRDAITREWSLKPPDAIHFATARLMRVSEFLTYDDRLYKCQGTQGSTPWAW